MKYEIRDGKIDEKLFQMGTLLFLLKESNTSDRIEQNENFFWFSEVVKAKVQGNYYEENFKELSHKKIKTDKIAQTKYFNFLNAICENLGFDLRKCSYVNVNSVGGGAYLRKDFYKKAERYLAEKKNKIAALAPKMILCCGTYKFFLNNFPDCILKLICNGAIVQIGGNRYWVIHTKHPTNRCISNDEALNCIVETYNKLKML